MRRFGIMQSTFPARRAWNRTRRYVPPLKWRLFHASGQKYGLKVLFFRAEDVDFNKRRVHAWSSPSAKGTYGWRRDWHPFPHVLYENYPTGRVAGRRRAISIKRKFNRIGIPVFNPPFYNKAELQSILSRHESIRPYLPDTKVVSKASHVTDFLKKYGFIYLKPIRGSMGRGIIEVRLLARYRVRVQADHFRKNRSLLRIFSLPQFLSFIRRVVRQQKYLVQQGLSLLKKGRRKIDFRVRVHRGVDGRWQVAGISPKLGKAGSMVTNLHAGGSKTTWESLQRWAFRAGTSMPTAGEIAKPALISARYLTPYRPTLSHLGIDVAVDRRNGIYLLDFNDVPGRKLLTAEMLRRVTDLTAGFARYLAVKR